MPKDTGKKLADMLYGQPFDVPTPENLRLGQQMIERELREKAARDAKLTTLDKAKAAYEAAKMMGSAAVAGIGSIPTRIAYGPEAAEKYVTSRISIPETEKGMDYVQNVGDFLEQLETKYKLPPILPEAMALQHLTGPATKQATRAAKQKAMQAAKAGERYAERKVPQIMERGGAGADILSGMAEGSQSKMTKAPSIIVPGTISKLQEEVAKKAGQYGAKRVQRAADEIPNLEKMYTEQALKEAFTGDNAKAVVTMNPADFEKYAQALEKRTEIGPKMSELAKQGQIDKYTVPTDEYIQHLMRLRGFDQVPYLNLFKDETGLPTLPNVVGHEGRHRSRALSEQRQPSSLVQISPRGGLREDLPRRSQEEYIDALREELNLSNRMIRPESRGSDDDLHLIRPAIELPDVYADGGRVHISDNPDVMQLELAGGGLVKGLMKAVKGTQEVVPAAEREANLAKMIEQSAVKNRVYHGTESKDDYVRSSKGNDAIKSFAGRATWVAEEPYTAHGYSGKSGYVMPLHVQIKKPLTISHVDANDDASQIYGLAKSLGVDVDHLKSISEPERVWEVINHPYFIDAASNAGFDGISIKEGGLQTHSVFDPSKIKSAIGNRGTYDVTDPDINKAEGGEVHMAGGGALSKLAKLARAPAKTKQEIEAIAERIAPQVTGEYVRAKPKSAVTVAGKTKKQFEREKSLPVDIRATAEERIPEPVDIEKLKGEVMIGIPGDPTVAGKTLYGVGDVRLESPAPQHGGPLYGLYHNDDHFWASGLGAARRVQNLAKEAAEQYEAPVVGRYIMMGPESINYAQHFADANLQAIDLGKMTKKQVEQFNKLIRQGSPASGPRPSFPGIEDKESAYLHMAIDPELRKHFNQLMQQNTVTEAFNLPSGNDIRFAITEGPLRDLETGVTGYSMGRMRPDVPSEGLKLSEHPTYSHDIPGEFLGQSKYPIPYELSFPDTLKSIRENPKQAPHEFGSLKMVGPRQTIDQQMIDEIRAYEERMKQLTGKKKGGAVSYAEGGEITADDLILEERKL